MYATIGIVVGLCLCCLIAVLIVIERKREKIDQRQCKKNDFRVGDVVQTQRGLDLGLVTKVNENNMPVEVMARPGGPYYTEASYYGGCTNVEWYKTGERMTIPEWFNYWNRRFQTLKGL